MNRGELVPDDVTIAMIRDGLTGLIAQSGALLDGFPRTPAQADALAEMLAEFGGKVMLVPYIYCAGCSVDRTLERTLDLPGSRACLSREI